MEKVKWKYDNQYKEWYEKSLEDLKYKFSIKKVGSDYTLYHGYFKVVGTFSKLSSAKTVANLLRHG